jgi:hypothetical protein
MDCPNCGVYNPDSRDICWRCDKPLPRPKEPKKRIDGAVAMRRLWIIIAVGLALYLLLTWVLPMILNP